MDPNVYYQPPPPAPQAVPQPMAQPPMAQPVIVQPVVGQPVMTPPIQQNVIPMNQPKHAREDHSCAGCPNVSKDKAVCVFLLDFFLGPLGVMISSCMDDNGCNGTVFMIGFLQFLLNFLFLLGGIWSFISGILTLVYSKE